MASQKYYVNEYKGFFWSEGLLCVVCGVCMCVCLCVSMCICSFVCAHSIDP